MSPNGYEVLYEMPWEAISFEGSNTEIRIGQAKDKKTGQNAEMQLTEAGDYSVDFFLDGKKFAAFPFKVVKLGDLVFTEGQCSEWGYLNYQNADPTARFYGKYGLEISPPTPIK